MFHFPSVLQQGSTGTSRRAEGHSLNATQQKLSTHPIFVKVEEELHDARRVQTDGQEDDLRYALNMVINRVTLLSSMLGEAYKAQAELEIQLNVAKSNLKLVIANNEMLEDALKQNMSAQSKDVGWNRTTREGCRESGDSRTQPERSQSVDIPSTLQVEPIGPPPRVATIAESSHTDNRFFRFRFSTPSVTQSRPITPTGQQPNSANATHLTSPSLPSLSSVKSKEIEVLIAELEKEKACRKKAKEEKAALEAELESLSQALFEEANKMVADERRLRAEIEDELKESRLEKEALQSALRLVAGEDNAPHDNPLTSSEDPLTPGPVQTINYDSSGRSSHSPSSQVAIKSRPQSLEPYPLPSSPAPQSGYFTACQEELPFAETTSEGNRLSLSTHLSPIEESQPTPRFQPSVSGTADRLFIVSPWADSVLPELQEEPLQSPSRDVK